MPVIVDETRSFAHAVSVVIIGGGACGSVAALAAHERGAEVIVLERDAVPRGNTALSGGQIPAAGTRLQRAAGIEDTPGILEADIIAKAKGQCDTALAGEIARASAQTVDWLVENHKLPLSCIADFQYPGHSRCHMHASPSRFGAELMDALTARLDEVGIDVVTSARVDDLYVDGEGRVRGVALVRPDGAREELGCEALILACNGYGGSPDLVARHIPTMVGAHYHGHPGNQGSAILWGEALGASVKDLGSYQGHGAVCTPHMIHLGWPVFTEGGIQVNAEGRRFSNENAGYSEQARKVLAQPGSVAWAVWDRRCDDIASQMHSHVEAKKAGAIRTFADGAELAEFIGCQADTLHATLEQAAAVTSGREPCPWGRDFKGFPPLEPPFFAAKITGALFHTQGGLEVDRHGRVLRADGTPFPNLFAGGGAARGLSGPDDWGYMSGSGLMMAVNLGRLAGEAAADLVAHKAAPEAGGISRRAAVAALAAAIFTVARPARADTPAPRFGLALPTSGSQALYGSDQVKAAEWALADINAGGGIGGRPLEMIVLDTQADPQIGIKAVNRLVSVDRVPVFITGFSSVVKAVAPIANDAKVVELSVAATAADISKLGDYVYTTSPLADVDIAAIARYQAGPLGLKRAGVLYINNETGITAAKVYREAFTAAGGQIIAFEAYDQRASDWTGPILKVRAQNPDVIQLQGLVPDSPLVIAQMRQLGLRQPVCSNTTIYNPRLIDQLGKGAEGVIATSLAPGIDDLDAVRSYVERWKKEVGREPNGLPYTQFIHDAVHIVAAVLRSLAAKNLPFTGEAFRSEMLAIRRFDLPLTGPLEINEDHTVRKPVILMEVKDGKWQRKAVVS